MQPRVTSHCHQVKWIFPPFSGPRIECVSFLLWATGCYFCKVTASVTSSLRPFGTIDITKMPHLHYMQAGSMLTLCQLNDAGNCGSSGQRLCPCAQFLYLPGQPAGRAEFCRLGNFVHRHGGLRSGLGSSSETLPDLWVSVFFFVLIWWTAGNKVICLTLARDDSNLQRHRPHHTPPGCGVGQGLYS